MAELCSILAFSMESKPAWFWFMTIFCSVFTLVGIYAFFYGLYQILNGFRTRRWPTAIATIIKTNLKTKQEEGGAIYKLEVRYRYTVDGRDFEGTVIHPTYCGLNNMQGADQLETMLSPDRQVYVYYNPSKPRKCLLAPGYYFGAMVAVSVGLLFAVMGTGFFFTFYFAMPGNSDFASGIQTIIP